VIFWESAAGSLKEKLRQSTEPRKKIVVDKMECHAMKRRMWLVGALAALLWATPAKADTGDHHSDDGGLSALPSLLQPSLSPCTIVGTLDGSLGHVFLVNYAAGPNDLH